MSRRVSDASNSISSTVNPRVKAVLRLRDRRGRDQTGLTLVDGIREIRRALAAGASIEEAYVGPSAVRGEGPVARAELAAAGVPLVDVSSAVEARLAFGDRVEGIVAVVHRPSLALDSLHLAPDPLVVVLEGLEKPGNLGAVLRSADGAGADALIVADPLADLFSPNAIRASLGTIFCVPSASGTVDEALAWCRARSIRPMAARVGADVVYTDADLTGPLAFVLGSEAEGLTAAWDRPEVESVRLPMHGIADSLNVSVAAAILLYEARRQREARTRATSVQANAGGGPDQSPRL